MSAAPEREREEVRWLLELVPDDDLPTLRRIVSALAVEPPCVSIDDAPEEDEDLSSDDLAAIEAGRQAKREGRVVSHEEARRRLGLARREDEAGR